MAETSPQPPLINLSTASGASRQRLVAEALASPRAALDHLERAAVVTGNYINVADGASVTVHRLVEALEDHGVEVVVVAPGGAEAALDRPETMLEVPALDVPFQQGYRLPLGLGQDTREALERFDPQLVHVASPEPASLAAMAYARRRAIPITSSFHTNFASYLRYWSPLLGALEPVAWTLLRLFYAPCEAVFVPTESMGDELVRHGVLDDYAILARGVDTARFGRRFRSMDWRRRHGIGVEERVVLFCARLVWEKGLRTLVDALDELAEIGPAHRVVIAGDGMQRDWLERQLPEAVFPGFLVGDELSRAYASADLFVYPSTTDTFGNVTLEAMASGLPVVGARAPGTCSLIDHGRTGLLAPPDNASALAAACDRLLRDDTLRRRLGEAAMAEARRYQWPEILDRFVADLDAIVAGAGASRPQARSQTRSQARVGAAE